MKFSIFGSLLTISTYLVCLTESSDPNFNFIQNIVDSVKNVFVNSFSNLPAVIRTMGETLSAAIDEDCEFKCPNGKRPKPNLYYEPKGNGCGVPGLQVPNYIPISKLEDCCTEHDICYGTCNKSKVNCDERFKQCLYKICQKVEKYVSEDLLKGCKAIAKTLYTAVTAMGCKYYLDAQKDACLCNSNYYDEL